MLFREHKVSSLFANHAECYWQIEEKGKGSSLVSIPEGTFELIFSDQGFYYQDATSQNKLAEFIKPGCWLVGQKTKCFIMTLPLMSSVFSIRLKAFSLASLSLVNPKELINQLVPFSSIKKSNRFAVDDFALIEDKIIHAKEFKQRRYYAERFLYNTLWGKPAIDEAFREKLNFILDLQGQVKIQQLERHFSLSRVSLRKQFLEGAGVLPKALSKVWRLNKFLLMQQQFPQLGHLNLALEAGFCDHSHLINDFKSVFAKTPLQYFKQSHVHAYHAQTIANRFGDKYPPVKLGNL